MRSSASPTYQELINEAAQDLYNESDTPRIDAELLLQHVLDRSMAWLIAYGDTLAEAKHVKVFYEIVQQRKLGQPIAYLIGYRDFWTLRLKVNSSVLIPRPDTETLIEHALECLPKNSPLTVLDLGTGSGAIALAIAKERPMARVTATDLMQNALDVAISNAASNQVTNVEFRQSNWFQDIFTDSRFDLIASNPPYVDKTDPHLQRGDLRFEPDTALVAESNGLADLTHIIEQAQRFLNPEGWLILEHGYNQAEDVAQLLESHGYCDIHMHKDINQLPRCTRAKVG